MREHNLKCRDPFFQHIWDGEKLFEIRKNDRDYSVGDVLVLNEIIVDAEIGLYKKTERIITAEVIYLTDYEQKEGYVVMSLRILTKRKPQGEYL